MCDDTFSQYINLCEWGNWIQFKLHAFHANVSWLLLPFINVVSDWWPSTLALVQHIRFRDGHFAVLCCWVCVLIQTSGQICLIWICSQHIEDYRIHFSSNWSDCSFETMEISCKFRKSRSKRQLPRWNFLSIDAPNLFPQISFETILTIFLPQRLLCL